MYDFNFSSTQRAVNFEKAKQIDHQLSNIHFLALYANLQAPEQFIHRTREAQADGNRSWCIFQAKIDERILRNIIHCTAELHYRFIAYRELDETKVVRVLCSPD